MESRSFDPVMSISPGESRSVYFSYDVNSSNSTIGSVPVNWSGMVITNSYCVDTSIDYGSFIARGFTNFAEHDVRINISFNG